MPVKTRSSTPHYLFGEAIFNLDESLLPSKLEIIQYYFYMVQFLKNVNENRQLSEKDYLSLKKIILSDVLAIWHSSSIPVKKETTIKTQLYELISGAETLDKNKHYLKGNTEEISKIRDKYKVLFDIAQCPCFRKKSETKCKCEIVEYQISTVKPSDKEFSDLEFYLDNKDFSSNGRKLNISVHRDINTTKVK